MTPQERRVLDLLRTNCEHVYVSSQGPQSARDAILDLRRSVPSAETLSLHASDLDDLARGETIKRDGVKFDVTADALARLKRPAPSIYLFADHLDALARGESVTLGGVTVTAGPGAQDRLNRAPGTVTLRTCDLDAMTRLGSIDIGTGAGVVTVALSLDAKAHLSRLGFHGDYVICVDDLDDLSSGKSVTASDGARFRVTDKVQDVIRAGLMSCKSDDDDVNLILERADLEPLARGEIVESPDGGTLRADPEAADALRRALGMPASKSDRIDALNHDDCPDAIAFTFDRVLGSPWITARSASKPADCLDMRPVLAKPARVPKNGDQLGTFDVAALDALPVGAKFVSVGLTPPLPPLVKAAPGTFDFVGVPYTAAGVVASWFDGDRVLVLPALARVPKNGDRLDSFTAAELDGLPVGSRFELADRPREPLIKRSPTHWVDAFFGDARDAVAVKAMCLDRRTLVLPKPAEAPKPAPSPKVGDLLRNLTPEQRTNLPIGTVLAPDLPSKPTMTKGADGKWHDTIYPTPVETQFLNFDRPIHWLPDPAQAAPTPAPAAAKAGDRWGDLAAEQRQSLPVGTVIKEEGCITVAVWTHLPSGWSKTVVDTASSVLFRTDTGEPTNTASIAFIPPTTESK